MQSGKINRLHCMLFAILGELTVGPDFLETMAPYKFTTYLLTYLLTFLISWCKPTTVYINDFKFERRI